MSGVAPAHCARWIFEHTSAPRGSAVVGEATPQAAPYKCQARASAARSSSSPSPTPPAPPPQTSHPPTHLPTPTRRAFVRSSQRHRTGVISSRHPRWGERFEMPVHVPEHQKLVGVGVLRAGGWVAEWMGALGGGNWVDVWVGCGG